LKIVHFAPLIEGYLDERLVKEVVLGISNSLLPEVIINRHGKIIPFKGGSKNKDKVLKNIKHLSQSIALLDISSEDNYLFIAGIDSYKDDHKTLLDRMEKEVNPFVKNVTILFVAVSDVETWAEYLLKPEFLKGSFEKGSSKDRIYPDGKSNENNARMVIQKLKELDAFSSKSLNHLSTQSPSFQHFHQQITAFIQQIS
jgi:hypothetical protein